MRPENKIFPKAKPDDHILTLEEGVFLSSVETPLKEEKPFVENLFSNEFCKSLEIAEYPKVFLAMYEAGLNVLQNKNAFFPQRIYAQKYLEFLTKKPEEENDKELDSFYQENDTNEIRGVVLNHTNESPLFEQRNLLGINSENEKPFDVKVLAPDNWSEMHFMEKEKWWLKNTGCPSLFVRRGFDKAKKIIPTIFLSPDDKLLLIKKNNKTEIDGKEGIDRIFQHEYRHTQRSFSIENGHLFRFIDEACTNVGSYQKLATVLHYIGLSTNEFDFFDIKKSYESGHDEEMQNIFKKIKAAIGDLGAILIGGKRSSEHTGDQDGIAELPLVELKNKTDQDNYYDTRFFETLLSLRAENDQKWLDKLKDNISVNASKVDRVFLEASISWFLQPYIKEVDDINTPNIHKFLEVIKEEIDCRKKLGEAGF